LDAPPRASFGDRTPSFGDLTPLLAPRSVAVVGASDREGNLGGLAVNFLQKFGYRGPVWPVNAGRPTVGGRPCFPHLSAVPALPDLVIIAVPAEAVIEVVQDCISVGAPAAIVWAGGFAEIGDSGRARQRQLEDTCRGTRLKLCGPNCIGVINTSIGLTASFSSLMTEFDRLTPGAVSMVSQSGGTAVTAHGRAQELGLGFRITISCGNEATLSIGDFIHALAQDDETRVIAVYVEGLSDPTRFVEALGEAKRRGKPIVILKGGANEQSGRAALAHTGKLAGIDRTYDAIFREFAAIRVYSTEELLDVSLQLASLRPGQLPASNRVLLSTFGGGSGVLAADQCMQQGLEVPTLDVETRARLKPIFSPLGSSMNPVDLTPGSMTNPKYRAMLPAVLKTLVDAPNIDSYVFLSAGFGALAPELAKMFENLRANTDKPICVSWLSPPQGITRDLAQRGILVFDEHARAIRAMGHLVRYAANTRHRIGQRPDLATPFAWSDVIDIAPVGKIVSENVAARVLELSGLPVAKGCLARTTEEAVRAADEVGYPVAIKVISPAITHRAAVGLVKLNVEDADAVARADRALRDRAAECGVALDGTWVQHMVAGHLELLVTAFRDRQFGVIVGCGMGGAMTEVIDDVVFARAPIDADGGCDLLGRLRTIHRLPTLLSDADRRRAADFLASFSALMATAPWDRFTFEVNPVKVGANELAAVDALLVIDEGGMV
jgi:acetate---CoA ligase (ADP-forming)